MQSPATEAAVASGSALFRGLADPSRLAILLELRKGERRVVDLACGGGLLAPHVPAGYRHVGVDQSASALSCQASRQRSSPVHSSIARAAINVPGAPQKTSSAALSTFARTRA